MGDGPWLVEAAGRQPTNGDPSLSRRVSLLFNRVTTLLAVGDLHVASAMNIKMLVAAFFATQSKSPLR